MNLTRFATVSVPGLPTNSPAPIVRAPADAPARVLVKNVGAVLIFISDDPQSLLGGSGPSAAFLMAPGDDDVIVLAPLQTLYGVGVAGGGLLSISLSDAVPVVR